jgi:hypothetical protein
LPERSLRRQPSVREPIQDHGPIIAGPWALHNVEDVERFAARIVERKRLDWLQPHERTDLLTFLIETTWELSERYEPIGYEFSQWARPTLDKRVTDWLRKEFFDARYFSEPPELVSLDDSEHDDLGAALTGSGVDDGSYRLADQLRALKARSRRPGRRNGGWVNARLAELRIEVERLDPG